MSIDNFISPQNIFGKPMEEFAKLQSSMSEQFKKVFGIDTQGFPGLNGLDDMKKNIEAFQKIQLNYIQEMVKLQQTLFPMMPFGSVFMNMLGDSVKDETKTSAAKKDTNATAVAKAKPAPAKKTTSAKKTTTASKRKAATQPAVKKTTTQKPATKNVATTTAKKTASATTKTPAKKPGRKPAATTKKSEVIKTTVENPSSNVEQTTSTTTSA